MASMDPNCGRLKLAVNSAILLQVLGGSASSGHGLPLRKVDTITIISHRDRVIMNVEIHRNLCKYLIDCGIPIKGFLQLYRQEKSEGKSNSRHHRGYSQSLTQFLDLSQFSNLYPLD